jgi:16S rRNA (guanine(966)-N(2))-methyltransferase RsmD
MKNSKISCFEVPIIGGTFKGKKICIPNVATTRSSKSILRESLFNTLQFDIVDANFVEVFAGSGSVGLEALSRGAAHAYFLERNREVFGMLQTNIRNISPRNAAALFGDSFDLFPPLLKRLSDENLRTYFYFDPPFSIREGMEEIYNQTLGMIELIDPFICEKTIVEHMSKLELPKTIGSLRREKEKRFGKSTLSYYVPDTAV